MKIVASLTLALLAAPIAGFTADAVSGTAASAPASTGSGATPVRQFQVMSGIDGSGWTLMQETPTTLSWRTPEEIMVILTACDCAPDDAALLSDPVKAQDFFRARALQRHGGLVEEQVRMQAGGYDVTTTKYKFIDLNPKSNDAVTNVYILAASFPQDRQLREIMLMAREGSPTGVREALVDAIRRLREPQQRMETPRHDPYDARFDATATYTDSDAREWDRLRPQHPLSAIRALMPRLLAKSRLPGVPESVAPELSAAAAAASAASR